MAYQYGISAAAPLGRPSGIRPLASRPEVPGVMEARFAMGMPYGAHEDLAATSFGIQHTTTQIPRPVDHSVPYHPAGVFDSGYMPLPYSEGAHPHTGQPPAISPLDETDFMCRPPSPHTASLEEFLQGIDGPDSAHTMHLAMSPFVSTPLLPSQQSQPLGAERTWPSSMVPSDLYLGPQSVTDAPYFMSMPINAPTSGSISSSQSASGSPLLQDPSPMEAARLPPQSSSYEERRTNKPSGVLRASTDELRRRNKLSAPIRAASTSSLPLPMSLPIPLASSPEGDDSSNSTETSPKRRTVQTRDNFRCEKCATHSTPQMRRGPNGPNTLCNACGLQWAKAQTKRAIAQQ